MASSPRPLAPFGRPLFLVPLLIPVQQWVLNLQRTQCADEEPCQACESANVCDQCCMTLFPQTASHNTDRPVKLPSCFHLPQVLRAKQERQSQPATPSQLRPQVFRSLRSEMPDADVPHSCHRSLRPLHPALQPPFRI